MVQHLIAGVLIEGRNSGREGRSLSRANNIRSSWDFRVFSAG